MLVLSRREREHIRVGDSIVVTVVRVSGDKVRLGIEAPADMLVLREELDPMPQRPTTATMVANDTPPLPIAPATFPVGAVGKNPPPGPPLLKTKNIPPRRFLEAARGKPSEPGSSS